MKARYDPDLDDRYAVLGNDQDGGGFVLLDCRDGGFKRVHTTSNILILDTRRQADALAEIMNLEDAERREIEEIAEHVEFPNGR